MLHLPNIVTTLCAHVKRKVCAQMVGRKSKGEEGETKPRNLRIAPDLVDAAAKVREPGETFTAQVEDGLRRQIAARRRKRQPSD